MSAPPAMMHLERNISVPPWMKPEAPEWMDPRADDRRLPVLDAQDIELENRWAKTFQEPDPDTAWCGPCEFRVKGELWSLDKFLGAGGLGQTYLATYKRTGRRYVLKFLRDYDDPEFAFLRSLPQSVFEHPNLLSYVGLAENLRQDVWPAAHLVFMEAIPNGELFEVLIAGIDLKKQLSEGTIRRFVQGIVAGMAELASHRVAHRDLKPENLLIDEHGQVVIIDLGHAAKADASSQSLCFCGCWRKLMEALTTRQNSSGSSSEQLGFFGRQSAYRGTKGYRSPEALSFLNFQYYDTERADVCTVGIIAFMMVCPTMPFCFGWPDLGENGHDEDWWEATLRSNPLRNAGASEGMKSFLNCLWREDPRRRPRFQDLKEVMERKPEALAKWPELSWLADDLSDPLSYVQELKARRPGFWLQFPGVLEAFSEYSQPFREEGDARRTAFDQANVAGDGHLTASELALQLQAVRPQLKALSDLDVRVAGLMSRHIVSKEQAFMNFKEFERMVKNWDALQQPNHNYGRRQPHSYTFYQPDVVQPSADQCKLFVDAVKMALNYESNGFKCICQPTDAGENGGNRYSLAASLISGKEELCQLRLDIFSKNQKIIMESKVRWGSAIEEMTMLQEVTRRLDVNHSFLWTCTDAPAIAARSPDAASTF